MLAGFALSGVVMALARDAMVRHGAWLLAALPAALVAAAAIGFHFVTTNPFNPLQLQNPETVLPQLAAIALYYASLLPFFFLAGLFVSLCFVREPTRIGRLYGFDLTGAGTGALLVLALMWLVHPFDLPACLLPALAAAAIPARRHRRAALLAAALMLAGGEALLLLDDQAAISDYKPIYAPAHTPDSKVVADLRAPRGLYTLLEDFTERVDTDLSNNAALLGLPGPPASFGLYRDGNRLAALPKSAVIDARYAPATLAALPYVLRPHAHVLLAGASGGFRIAELRALGAAETFTLEPEPVLRRALLHGLGPAPAIAPDPAEISADGLVATALRGGRWDIIDISADFLDSAEANASAFAAEALAADLRALAPGGILSIPVGIREFPAYALRVLATARLALIQAHVPDPLAGHVLVYRSAWNVRILLSPTPFTPADLEAARAFCNDRSFDIAFALHAPRATEIFNDLPQVSLDSGEVDTSGGPHDAIADEAAAILAGSPTPSAEAFDLRPITLDRPAFFALLRLDRLGTILRRLEILPQGEIGPVVNLAVLAQAAVIALLVLAVPFAGRVRLGGPGAPRAALYFSTLGLGFLFLEIFFIERGSFYLNDRSTAFALVLTTMLVFSGLGSLWSARFAANPGQGHNLAVWIVLFWLTVLRIALEPALLATIGLPLAARMALLVVAVAPVSVALGMPFPLGLGQLGRSRFMPWAWGLNGAFSVVATPLANLLAITQGQTAVLLTGTVLYVIALLTFPRTEKAPLWQTVSAR